jgi:hypothetical protein
MACDISVSSQSQSYFTIGGLPPISSSWRQTPSDSRPAFFQLNTCGHNPYVTSTLTRGWVYRLQLLLVLASAVILMSESRGTHDILLSHIRDSPNQEGRDSVFISPRERVVQLYSQTLDSLSVASYDSEGYGGIIRPRLQTDFRFLFPAAGLIYNTHRYYGVHSVLLPVRKVAPVFMRHSEPSKFLTI